LPREPEQRCFREINFAVGVFRGERSDFRICQSRNFRRGETRERTQSGSLSSPAIPKKKHIWTIAADTVISLPEQLPTNDFALSLSVSPHSPAPIAKPVSVSDLS
jgi:hypothetical protein